jgi:hypothetical protein
MDHNFIFNYIIICIIFLFVSLTYILFRKLLFQKNRQKNFFFFNKVSSIRPSNNFILKI